MPSCRDLQTFTVEDIQRQNPRRRGVRGGRTNPVRFIIVHHTGGPELSDAITTLQDDGNAYHYLVDKNGRIKLYVDPANVAFHAGNVNGISIGIALVGNDDADIQTRYVQVAQAEKLIRWLMCQYGISNRRVYGHGELRGSVSDRGKQATEGLTVVRKIRGTDVPFQLGPNAGSRGGNWYDSEFTPGPDDDRSDDTDDQPVNSSAPTRPSTVTPYIGSLESFHPNIQYELTRRRVSENTANVYMPFVRLTSLTNVLGKNIRGLDRLLTTDSLRNRGNNSTLGWCPTLGVHGEDSIGFSEIYQPLENRSVVGYATIPSRDGDFDRIPIVTDADAVATDAVNIPIPGITEVSAERGTAGPMGVRGGLMRADIKIRAYSVGQLDVLLRYFLRPATRVVLEFGRRSSEPNDAIKSFDWRQSRETLRSQFTNLIYDQSAQRKFIEDYVYSNNGNYEILIGYVVKFGLKYTKDNVYEISLTVHSVQQFEVPTVHTGVKSNCPDATSPCVVTDVREYFTATDSSYKPNTFNSLLGSITGDRNNPWYTHVIPIPPTTEESETEYYVSWTFFVDMILNDPNKGIASLIRNESTRKFIKMGLLRPVTTPTDEEINGGATDSQLIADQVGYHPDLRSTNPNVMVIYNETAQNRLKQEDKQVYEALLRRAFSAGEDEERAAARENRRKFDRASELYDRIRNDPRIGSFRNRTPGADNTRAAAGFLSDGVWLNTTAIKQAFTQADTVSSALDSLLTQMNNATEGYWNLQLYSTDRNNPGIFVVDMGLAKKPVAAPTPAGTPNIDLEQTTPGSTNILNSLNNIDINRYGNPNTGKPKYIYMFNRGMKHVSDGELGSELLDLNVEYNLPQVIAVQAIAGVGGAAQKSTLQSIDIAELNRISLIENLFATCPPNAICAQETCPSAGELESARVALERVRSTRTTRDFFRRSTRLLNAEREAVIKFNDALLAERYGNILNGVDTIRQLSSVGTLLQLVEFNPPGMLKKLNLDSTNVEDGRVAPYAHSFNSSNLTKTVVNLTTAGIGGIELFQSFLVARVPSILERGFYIVTKVTHKFSFDKGWTTAIEGRFRYRPLNENSATAAYQPTCADTPSSNTIQFETVSEGLSEETIREQATIAGFVAGLRSTFGF